ncbi:MAG: hypothetical protein JST86_14060 [Bacteroidetes bacterium]|nr:hypothetical protein [Bacteroidota bacterium]
MTTENLQENEFENQNGNHSSKPKRKRIYKSEIYSKTSIVIEDPLEYKVNKSTQRGRMICTATEEVIIDVWGDKHYFDRHHQGDDNGKRDGIDPATIEDFIRRCIKHLFMYSSVWRKFKFVNFNGQPENNTRVILREEYNGTMLNVVTETHLLGVNRYEITVTTAMCTNEFRAQIGQYVIELQGESSTLYVRENRPNGSGLEPVCSF